MLKFHDKPKPEQVDDIELINEVKLREFLYKTKHPDYRNLPKRSQAWAEIAETLKISDFNVVSKRWKVVREKYAIAYRKFTNDKVQPNYIHYEKCNFLADYVNLNVERKKGNDQESDHSSVETDNTSTNQSRFDDNLLAKMVRHHPVIYDRNHQFFKFQSERNRAWREIAKETGWNSQQIQKRWKVMRDRFVRELRKSKNVSDSSFSCSHFFGDMLFLAPHVKSKNYEIEADFENLIESEQLIKTEDKLVLSEIVESEIENHNFNYDDEHENEVQEDIPDSQEYDNVCYVEEVFDDNHENSIELHDEPEEAIDDEVIENEVTFVDEEEECFNSTEEINYDNECNNIIDDSGTSRKRKNCSFEENERSHKISRSETPQAASSSSLLLSSHEPQKTVTVKDYSLALTDEDLAFGQTIGLMLKKIPNNLKTAVKLKIFQSLDEFEILHKLK